MGDSEKIAQLKIQLISDTKALKELKRELSSLHNSFRPTAPIIKKTEKEFSNLNSRILTTSADIKKMTAINNVANSLEAKRLGSVIKEQAKEQESLAKINNLRKELNKNWEMKTPREQSESLKRRLTLLKQEGKAVYDLEGMSVAYKKNISDVARLQSRIDKLNTTIKSSEGQTPFAGWAMSIMFAGMAMQRFATQIKQFGVKAFDDISHSVEGTVTSNDKLQASMTMLGFSVGQALQPLLDLLVPIVDSISDWVDKNPDLTKDLIALGVVLGTLFMVGGGATLAINGFKDLVSILKNIPNSAASISNYDWAGLGTKISTGIGIIGIGYGIYEASEGIADIANGKFLEGTLKALGGTMMSYGSYMMIMGKGGLPLILIGAAINLLGEGTLFKQIQFLGAVMFAILASSIEALSVVVSNVLLSPLTAILSLIAAAYESLNLSPPGWINNYLDNLESMSAEGLSFGSNFKEYYQGSMASGWGEELDKQIADVLATPKKASGTPEYYDKNKQSSAGNVFNFYGDVVTTNNDKLLQMSSMGG